MLTADAVGGVWQYTTELARGLAAAGVESVVVTLGPDTPPADIHSVEVIDTGLPLDWTAESERDLQAAAHALARLASALAVDLVHLHAPAFAASGAWPCPVISVAHSCVGTWWRAVRGGGDLPPDLAWRAEATARGLRRSDAAIAPSLALADALRAVYGDDLSFTVIHNGRTAPVPAGAPERRERAILTAGRLWDEAKNVAVLDRAAARLAAPVYAAGPTEGPNGASVTLRHARPLGTLDGPALRSRMTRTAIYASPALYEPFGLGVLEAAQCGMALVLADIPSLRELWDEAALFVAPEDADGWTATLSRLLDDPTRAEILGTSARAHASRYSSAAMVERTAAVHRSALGHARLASVA